MFEAKFRVESRRVDEITTPFNSYNKLIFLQNTDCNIVHNNGKVGISSKEYTLSPKPYDHRGLFSIASFSSTQKSQDERQKTND